MDSQIVWDDNFLKLVQELNSQSPDLMRFSKNLTMGCLAFSACSIIGSQQNDSYSYGSGLKHIEGAKLIEWLKKIWPLMNITLCV